MANKVICYISSGITGLILLMYLMTTLMAYGTDWKVMLILLLIVFPFLVLGFIGGLISNKKKILAIIFMILCGISTAFLGLMCMEGGLGFLGIFALPLGIISLILYIISSILTAIKNDN